MNQFTQDEIDTMLDKDTLPDETAVPQVNDAAITEPEVGVDSLEVGLDDEEGAATYPVPDNKRMGVSTPDSTDPATMDQGDEANDAIIWGTPDDPFTEDVSPGILTDEETNTDSE